jgi:hypothetical protein
MPIPPIGRTANRAGVSADACVCCTDACLCCREATRRAQPGVTAAVSPRPSPRGRGDRWGAPGSQKRETPRGEPVASQAPRTIALKRDVPILARCSMRLHCTRVDVAPGPGSYGCWMLPSPFEFDQQVLRWPVNRHGQVGNGQIRVAIWNEQSCFVGVGRRYVAIAASVEAVCRSAVRCPMGLAS